MRISRSTAGFVVLLLACTLLGLREFMLLPNRKTHFYFFDVGQGDGALVVSPSGRQILVDGGPDWKLLEGLGETMPFFDRTIDLVVLSHAHLDHIVSLPEVLARYSIGALLLTETPASLPQYGKLLEAASKYKINVQIARSGDRMNFEDGLHAEILWPPRNLSTGFAKNHNNVSIVMKFEDGQNAALFMGDAEEIVERTLLASKANLKANLLKSGHHGSKTSSTEEFLKFVRPSAAIVSSGIGNRFGHPSPESIDRFRRLGIPVHRTDAEGDIEIAWSSLQ